MTSQSFNQIVSLVLPKAALQTAQRLMILQTAAKGEILQVAILPRLNGLLTNMPIVTLARTILNQMGQMTHGINVAFKAQKGSPTTSTSVSTKTAG